MWTSETLQSHTAADIASAARLRLCLLPKTFAATSSRACQKMPFAFIVVSRSSSNLLIIGLSPLGILGPRIVRSFIVETSHLNFTTASCVVVSGVCVVIVIAVVVIVIGNVSSVPHLTVCGHSAVVISSGARHPPRPPNP